VIPTLLFMGFVLGFICGAGWCWLDAEEALRREREERD
jgi:hypothetical protein